MKAEYLRSKQGCLYGVKLVGKLVENVSNLNNSRPIADSILNGAHIKLTPKEVL